MSSDGRGGFSYEVSDEQIAAYAAMPIDRRVRWLEDLARTTYALATPEVRARWSALREGRAIEDTARPRRCDEELASPLDLPVANYWLVARFPAHDEVLVVWPDTFEPIVRHASPASLLAWMDEGAQAEHVITDVAGLAARIARVPVDAEHARARDRLARFFGVASDAGSEVRITRE